jgi:subtilisin family serine protease
MTCYVPAAFAADPAAAEAAAVENYIVKFGEAGLLYYKGEVAGLRATEPAANGQRKLDVKTQAATAYRNHLATARSDYMGAITAALSRNADPLHDYDVMFHGVALSLSAEEAQRLRSVPGIVSVEPGGTYYLDTDAGPQLIGAPAVWDGSAVVGGTPVRGEGVIVGVIDSGGNADHPSFSNDADPTCGFDAGNPKLVASYDCLAANCVGGNPEDTDPSGTGHGVHTASTAAGNALTPPLTVQGVDLLFPISGVAPCAHVITYKVCGTNTCDGTAIVASTQQAIIDQVDVINYSISGGRSPWSDQDRNFLDAVNADIFVAASAGNTRDTVPDPFANVNHRGPWVMSVANSTHDRVVGFPVDVEGGPQDVPAQAGSGPEYPDGDTTAMVASAAALGNELGCNAGGGFAAGSMTGRIALISRGSCPFAEKITNATTAGAVAAIVYNNAGGPPIAMGGLEASTIPSAMTGRDSGIAIRDFLVGSPDAMMTVSAPATRVTDIAFADILNSSSLQGPNVDFDVTKPDITNPGTNIYAAIGDIGGQFGFLSGTSMSSPHTAGSGALVRGANPTWTPQEIKSALQLTTKRDGFFSDATTPWTPEHVGNGRVDLNNAARAGLVMDETFANFLAANPASGGNPRTLNLPSMRFTNCPGSCMWERTVRNARDVATSWNVSVEAPPGVLLRVVPDSFDFTGGLAETQTLRIFATVIAATPDLSYGRVNVTENTDQFPESSMTVAITGTAIPGGGSADALLIDSLEDIAD